MKSTVDAGDHSSGPLNSGETCQFRRGSPHATPAAFRTTEFPAQTLRSKGDTRRDQLAQSALTTLSQLGYARSSLREIAQNSEFSHGVVHYYFTDKIELISHCLRYLRTRFTGRYDDVIICARTPDQLANAFANRVVEAIEHDLGLQRLWYDLRSQSMFEPRLRDDVHEIEQALERMVWSVLVRYGELCGKPPRVAPATAYGMFDGVFAHAVLNHSTNDPDSLTLLHYQVSTLLTKTVTL